MDKNRVDGSRVRLAEVEVGDETGCVSLRARDDQIDILQQISSASGAVVLRNCTLELYQGKHIRLAVTKWGKLSRYPDQVASTPPPPEKINKERNFSFIDLNRVASSVASFRDPYGATETEGRQPQQQHHHQSSGGRTQSYGQSPNQGRRGGSRRSSRGNKPSGSQQSMPVPPPPQQHYTDRYPGGLHGYGTGFVDNSVMDPQQYSYNVRQQERHQHMMMQHQYEMQHRQMQHMYHQPQQTQHQQQQQQDPSRSSPMLVPGISSPPSFDGSSFGPEVPMAMAGANPFLYSQQQQQQQQRPNLMQQPQEPRSHESTPPATPQNATPPETPGMNPQAATFDPSPPPGPK